MVPTGITRYCLDVTGMQSKLSVCGGGGSRCENLIWDQALVTTECTLTANGRQINQHTFAFCCRGRGAHLEKNAWAQNSNGQINRQFNHDHNSKYVQRRKRSARYRNLAHYSLLSEANLHTNAEQISLQIWPGDKWTKATRECKNKTIENICLWL